LHALRRLNKDQINLVLSGIAGTCYSLFGVSDAAFGWGCADYIRCL